MCAFSRLSLLLNKVLYYFIYNLTMGLQSSNIWSKQNECRSFILFIRYPSILKPDRMVIPSVIMHFGLREDFVFNVISTQFITSTIYNDSRLNVICAVGQQFTLYNGL